MKEQQAFLAQPERADIKSMNLAELQAALADFGEPAYRAKQVFHWLHQKQVDSFDQMTDLSASLRTRLAEQYFINQIKLNTRDSGNPSNSEDWTFRT